MILGAFLLTSSVTPPAAGTSEPASDDHTSIARVPLRRTDPQGDADPGRLLVRMAADADPRRFAQTHDLELLGRVGATGFIAFGTAGRRAENVAEDARSDSRALRVELDHVRTAFAVPDDHLYSPKFGMRRYMELMRFPQAWDRTQGSPSTKVAVLDTGVDLDHPDLRAAILPGRDFVDDDARPTDKNGHGTMVAGMLAARTNNGLGVAGAAWSAGIVPVRVLDADGEGTDSDIAAGITWAADQGVKVMNLSFGGPTPSAVLKSAIGYAAKKGVVVVAAAGNGASDQTMYPAGYAEPIAVSATDWSGDFAWFSTHGAWVDVAAPGLDIYGPVRSPGPRDVYAFGSGTSFSAALVSGAAVLVRSANPSLSAAKTIQALRTKARDAGPRGIDLMYGFGILDVVSALGDPRRPAFRHLAGDKSEPNDTPARATPLPRYEEPPGTVDTSPMMGTIAPEGDVDWYVTEFDDPTRWLYLGGGGHGWQPNVRRAQEMDTIVRVYGPDLRLLDEADERGLTRGEGIVLPPGAPGRYYLEVRSVNGAMSPAKYTLAASYVESDDADGAFGESRVYPAGSSSSPEHVVVADVTGDGLDDVVMVTGSWSDDPYNLTLFVYAQRPDGWFRRPELYRLPGADHTLTSVAAGDMNGDGLTDIVVGIDAGISVMHQSEGRLGAPQRVSTLDVAVAEVADMNGDGLADIVAKGYVLRNDGTTFTVLPLAGPWMVEVGVGDVTGDGRLDVVGVTHADPATGRIYVYPGRADGTFGPAVTTPTEGQGGPTAMEVADVTGDGRVDVTLAMDPGGTSTRRITVYPRLAAGGLGVPVIYDGGPSPDALEAADFDRDGRMDLVVVNGGWHSVRVLYQRNDGTLAAPGKRYWIPYATTYQNTGLAAEDFTGDGFADIAIADYNNGLVVLRRRTATWPRFEPPWVVDTSPADRSQFATSTVRPTLTFGRQMLASSITNQTVTLINGNRGQVVGSSVSYNPTSRVATLTPFKTLGGNRPFIVRVAGVRDASGRTIDAPYEFRFTVGQTLDKVPPDTYFRTGPYGIETHPFYSFMFASNEPSVKYQCKLDAQVWKVCTSPAQGNAGKAYDHTFRVRAIDPSGNVDPSEAVWTWSVDRVARVPSNDCFCRAVALSGRSGSVAGSNVATTNQPNEPLDGNRTGTVWYAWTAPASGRVTFDTAGTGFDTTLAVTRGPDVDSKDRVAMNDDVPGGTTSRVGFTAAAGTTYYIAVGGWANVLGPYGWGTYGPFTLTWRQ